MSGEIANILARLQPHSPGPADPASSETATPPPDALGKDPPPSRPGILQGPYEIKTNDIVRFKAIYTNGQLDGPCFIYDPQGQLIQKMTYAMGSLTGVSETYQHTQLKSKTPYENNQKQGMEEIFYINGQLMMTLPFVHNKLEGVVTTYTDQGGLLSTYTYRLGLLSGPWVRYHGDGATILQKGVYENHLLEGMVCEYNAKGKLIKESMYHKGKLVGMPRLPAKT